MEAKIIQMALYIAYDEGDVDRVVEAIQSYGSRQFK